MLGGAQRANEYALAATAWTLASARGVRAPPSVDAGSLPRVVATASPLSVAEKETSGHRAANVDTTAAVARPGRGDSLRGLGGRSCCCLPLTTSRERSVRWGIGTSAPAPWGWVPGLRSWRPALTRIIVRHATMVSTLLADTAPGAIAAVTQVDDSRGCMHPSARIVGIPRPTLAAGSSREIFRRIFHDATELRHETAAMEANGRRSSSRSSVRSRQSMLSPSGRFASPSLAGRTSFVRRPCLLAP